MVHNYDIEALSSRANFGKALQAVRRSMPACNAWRWAGDLLNGKYPDGARVAWDGDTLLVTDHGTDTPDPGCRWNWEDSGLKFDCAAGIVTAFTCGGHWLDVRHDGVIMAADSHRGSGDCRFWGK